MRRATLLLAVTALTSQGCFSVRYVAQAAWGEAGILHAARPIREVVSRQEAPGRIERLLLSVHAIKAYGQSEGLTATGNYRSYADLRRPAAVWVVQACAPLAFDVRRWSFPLVGSIPYLGYFDREAAQRQAAALAEAEGLDVDVRGASAFSTLGWLRDPVLSTMIGGGDEALGQLAEVVLHESVHATHYVASQSAFDESLASFVAELLAPRWLARVLGPDAPETRAWLSAHAAHRTRVERLHRAYLELDVLYRSGASDDEKRREKARLLAAVQEELRLPRPLSNAALAGFRTYDSGRPAFERLLAACGGSWPRFLRAIRSVGPTDFARPQQEDFDEVVDRLTGKGCPR